MWRLNQTLCITPGQVIPHLAVALRTAYRKFLQDNALHDAWKHTWGPVSFI